MNDTPVPPSPFAPYTPPTPPQTPRPAAPVPVVEPDGVRVTFTGNRREFFNLIARGAALGLITFGFYRFWLSTYVRRHLWSHTAVDGDAPEYTGTPIELLIGFLFALAILVPIYLAYFFIGLEAEIYQAFASIPLFIFFYLFAQFAIYRARRYRLSRTVWRGVRFWMRGSGWDYAWRAGLWLLFVAVSFGVALPWRTAALERFKMQHSYYGNLQGSFNGVGGALFSEVWPFWLAGLLLGTVGWIFPPLVLIGAPFVYAIYKAIEWRWWISNIRFGGVSFQSDLRNTALLGLYWKVIGWTCLLTLGMSLAFAGLFFAIAAAKGVNPSEPSQIARLFDQVWVLIPFGALYIVTVLAVGVVMQLYLTHDLWQRVTESTRVHNLAAADNVIAQGEISNALGEGFANSLDVGGL